MLWSYKMKKIFKIATLAAFLASTSMANAAQKIAVVVPAKIMQQSPQLEKIKTKLEAEFKGRIAELKKLEKDIVNLDSKMQRDASLMSANDVTSLKRQIESKKSDFTLKRKAFAEDSRRRQAEEQQKSWAVIRDAISSVASKNGYDLVLNGEQVAFAKPEYDISDIVIKEISKK